MKGMHLHKHLLILFEMGYDDFEIETSLEETLDAKLN